MSAEGKLLRQAVRLLAYFVDWHRDYSEDCPCVNCQARALVERDREVG